MKNTNKDTEKNNKNETENKDMMQESAALLKQMVKIVKECRDKYEGDLGGDLYIRGNLPKQKMRQTVELLSKLLPDAAASTNAFPRCCLR